MTYYEFLVFVHVLAAVVWVGGNAVLQVLAARAQAAGDPARSVALLRDVEWVGMRVFMPASLVLILAGILAVIEADFDWGQAWISIGFAVWIASFLIGMGFLGPESGRLKRLVAEKGLGSPEVTSRTNRILLVSRIELVLLLVVVWAMVAKPGL